MPYFSVIMPTKNRAHLISESIKSIIDQNFQDWELIVIDDHSSDQTELVINDFNNPKIKYFKLTTRTGPGAARDFGINKSSGEIIVLADSDDYNLPNRLEVTHQTFISKNVDIIYGRVLVLKDNLQEEKPTIEFNAEILRAYNFIPNPTTAFKKEAYLNCGRYNQTIKTSEDYDLWLKMLEKNYKFQFVDHILVKQIIHSQSITKSTDIQERKNNLALVRQNHQLTTPDVNQVLTMINNKKLKELLSSKSAINFWFND